MLKSLLPQNLFIFYSKVHRVPVSKSTPLRGILVVCCTLLPPADRPCQPKKKKSWRPCVGFQIKSTIFTQRYGLLLIVANLKLTCIRTIGPTPTAGYSYDSSKQSVPSCWSRYRKNRRNFMTDQGEEGRTTHRPALRRHRLPQVGSFFFSSVEPNSADLLGPKLDCLDLAKLDCLGRTSVWIC
jgi:hypothetical protein